MSFELTALVSSPVPPERRVALISAALERWPFLRIPIDDEHPERVVLGSLERTGYASGVGRALDQLLLDTLTELSSAFPDVGLALVHTDCFGGHCEDEGWIYRAGQRVESGLGLVAALARVGLETTGHFAGFERNHFGYNFDPWAFVHLLDPVAIEELDEEPELLVLEREGPDVREAELVQLLGQPRRLRSIVAQIGGPPGCGAVLVGGFSQRDLPVVWRAGPDQAAPHPTWQWCIAARLDSVEQVDAELDRLGAGLEQVMFGRPELLELISIAEIDVALLARLIDGARARFRLPVQVLDAASLVERARARGPVPELWLMRALERAHARAGLAAFELGLLARLDATGPIADEAWRVLADWLTQRGHPSAEALQLDLRLRGMVEPSVALREHAASSCEACWTETDKELLAIVGKRRNRALFGSWWPVMWADWRGPFLHRLAIATVWANHRGDDSVLERLEALFALPSARYLDHRRVTLLACPFEPELSARELSGLSLDEGELGETFGRWPADCLVSMRGARLEGCAANKLQAQRVDLREASLVDAELRGADLHQADLRGADLRRADLRNADLRYADLRGARLEGTKLDYAKLEGTRLS